MKFSLLKLECWRLVSPVNVVWHELYGSIVFDLLTLLCDDFILLQGVHDWFLSDPFTTCISFLCNG